MPCEFVHQRDKVKSLVIIGAFADPATLQALNFNNRYPPTVARILPNLTGQAMA